MSIPLRQSTASQEVILGYFLDDTDGKTAETGLTIANTDIKIWVHGATTLANKNSGGASHISGGLYYATFDDTDTATLGGLVIFIHVSGALPVRVPCHVYPANVFDSLFSTDKLQVDCRELGDSALDLTTTMKASVNSEADTALSDYDGVVPADLPSNFGDLAITATTGKVTVGTNDDKTGYTASTVSDKTGYSLAVDQSGVTIGQVDALGTQAKADVNAEVDTALNTAIPGSPTANSINERVKAIDDKLPTGTISDFDESADQVEVATNNDKTGYSISGTKNTLDDMNDITVANIFSYVVENSKSFLTILRLIYSFNCNKTTGGGSNTVNFRDDADTKNRLVMTVDVDNNRTAVVKDAS